jgi:DHA1 family bicyclomycin/chloramphenicol resistance-like MFS transporter
MLAPSLGLAALLTTLVALGPISTDLYLPALPTLAQAFDSDVARVQLTLSVFLAGFAVAQLAYGPLSDRYGRRPVLLGGLALYLVASLACMGARSIDELIAARFVQALGACAGPVIGRAIVRDVYGPVQAARVLAYISGAMAIAPMVGPMLGGYLTVWFGWRANFVALALFSALQLFAVFVLLGESNAHKDPAATRPRHMLANFALLFRSRHFLGCLLCFAASYAIIFSFISGSSFVLISVLGISPQRYGASFGFAVAGYISGTMLSGRLVLRLGMQRLVLAGALLACSAGSVMAACALLGGPNLWAILLPMFLCMLATGLVMPNAIAGALAPHPKMAGAASALIGFVQMSFAALVGVAVGHAWDGTALPMAAAIALCGWAVLAAYWFLMRPALARAGRAA